MLLPPPSLLITDDDDAFRFTLRDVFEPQGFHTLAARDGQEALQIVSSEPVHLVVLDMHMPRLTGLETLTQLKRVNESLPCILLSADLDREIIEQARSADVFEVLPKPISGRVITRVVREALQAAYRWDVG